ncbi:hypothetical protein D3C78_1380500 [compost metagenome]
MPQRPYTHQQYDQGTDCAGIDGTKGADEAIGCQGENDQHGYQQYQPIADFAFSQLIADKSMQFLPECENNRKHDPDSDSQFGLVITQGAE